MDGVVVAGPNCIRAVLKCRAGSNFRAALSVELGTRCGPSSKIPQTDRFINGLKGGLLADESGLGKKVQVIAFLVYLKDRFSQPGPHLVVALG